MPRTKSSSPSPAQPSAGLNPAKLRLLHVARRQLNLAEDDYRSILTLYGGASSAADLHQQGFTAVMAQMERLGFRSTSARRPLAARNGMASPGQVGLIRHLWAECTDDAGTDATLGNWLERQFGVFALRFVPQDQAPKIIAGLKSMGRKLSANRSAETDPHHAA